MRRFFTFLAALIRYISIVWSRQWRRHRLRLVAIVVLVAVLTLSIPVGVTVSAASTVSYPTYCLGGWQNPQNAGGEPNADQADLNSYTKDNSAVLDQTITDMYCGYFQAEAHDNQPNRLILSFSWKIGVEEPKPIIPIDDPRLDPPKPIEPTPIEVLPPINDKKPVEPALPIVPPAPIEAQLIPHVQAAELPVDIVPIKDTVPLDPGPVISPVQIVPQPEPTPPVGPPASVPTQGGNSSDFLQISYSTDGMQWHRISGVNTLNWKGYSDEIPVSNWQDINSLQIAIHSQSSFDRQPTVYLDAIKLEARYAPTVSEFVDQATQVVTDTVTTVVDQAASITQQVVDAIADLFKPVEPADKPVEVPPVVTATQPTPTPPPVPVMKKQLLFSLEGSTTPTHKILSWMDRDQTNKVQAEPHSQDLVTYQPTIDIAADKKSVQLSGVCSKPYVTILLFRNIDDYDKKPSNFIFNTATKCDGGKFSFSLDSLSADTVPATYYLLIGEQGEEGSWVPASASIPISIGSVIEEVKS